jgi:hypothetical protein
LPEVFDELARPRVRQAAAGEIFFGQRPVLLVVEPESQCWLSGRISPSRDAEQWAKELQPLANLEHRVRDGAKGIEKGLATADAKRQEDQQAVSSDQPDHSHTPREGRRALRKTQAKAERAWSAAEGADKKQERQRRRMEAETGHATQAVLAWRRAEQAFRQWESDEAVFEQIRVSRDCRSGCRGTSGTGSNERWRVRRPTPTWTGCRPRRRHWLSARR